jgi:CDP-diacylglycerol--glycerol-3-phosphate 3-phosphatidyltransferase
MKDLTSLNAATWLTLSRFLLFPSAVLPLALGWNNAGFISACVTQLAGLTDFADGIVARRTGNITPLGTTLDYFSDKLFIGGMLVTLAWSGLIPAWIPIVVLVREAAVSIVRFSRFKWDPPSPDLLGKSKTMFSYAAIMGVALQRDLASSGIVASINSNINIGPVLSQSRWLMYAALALTLVSGLNYMYKYLRKNAKD